jgi:hypothetical protein
MSPVSVYLPRASPFVGLAGLITRSQLAEQEMLERTNCEVWGYDFSVGGFSNQLKPEMLHRTHFMQAGISGNTEAEKTPPFYTIQDLMQKNGHSYM